MARREAATAVPVTWEPGAGKRTHWSAPSPSSGSPPPCVALPSATLRRCCRRPCRPSWGEERTRPWMSSQRCARCVRREDGPLQFVSLVPPPPPPCALPPLHCSASLTSNACSRNASRRVRSRNGADARGPTLGEKGVMRRSTRLGNAPSPPQGLALFAAGRRARAGGAASRTRSGTRIPRLKKGARGTGVQGRLAPRAGSVTRSPCDGAGLCVGAAMAGLGRGRRPQAQARGGVRVPQSPLDAGRTRGVRPLVARVANARDRRRQRGGGGRRGPRRTRTETRGRADAAKPASAAPWSSACRASPLPSDGPKCARST